MFSWPQRETKVLVAIHGWSGVILGLLLYAVVLTGTIAVLDREIGRWSTGQGPTANPFDQPISEVVEKLSKKVGRAYREDVSLSINAAGNLVAFFHKHIRRVDGRLSDRGMAFEVDPATGEILNRREGFFVELRKEDRSSALSRFFIDTHVRLYLPHPWGLLLTGVLGFAMLVASISGLFMHRHLVTDIFTLRSGRNFLLNARDRHTVAATWGLPFSFLLAFTGTFFSFAGSFALPALAMVAFGGNQMEAIKVLFGTEQLRPGPRIKTGDLDRIIADARARTGSPPRSMSIEHYGRQNVRVTTEHVPAAGELQSQTLIYEGVSGEYLRHKPGLGTTPSFGSAVVSVIASLHFGNFAGIVSKAVWVALGVASTYVILSGLQLWLRRRDESPGWRAYEKLFDIVAFGLPLSLAASAIGFFMFFGTEHVIFWTPGAFAVSAIAITLLGLLLDQRQFAGTMWASLTLALLSLPVVRMAAGGSNWWQALMDGQTSVVGIDLLLTVIGCLAALKAYRQFNTASRLGYSASEPLTKRPM